MDHPGCEGQRSENSRQCEQQRNFRLFVDHLTAFRVVHRHASQARIEIRSHGLQNEADVNHGKIVGCLELADSVHAFLVCHQNTQ